MCAVICVITKRLLGTKVLPSGFGVPGMEVCAVPRSAGDGRAGPGVVLAGGPVLQPRGPVAALRALPAGPDQHQRRRAGHHRRGRHRCAQYLGLRVRQSARCVDGKPGADFAGLDLRSAAQCPASWASSLPRRTECVPGIGCDLSKSRKACCCGVWAVLAVPWPASLAWWSRLGITLLACTANTLLY